MIKRISLSELSEQALDQTLDKYSGAINGYPLSWTWCGICIEIEYNADTDMTQYEQCAILCPLYPSRWCRNAIQNSRLYKQDTQLNAWKTDVNNYLWWITTELELRRTKYERKWGGAW